MNQKQLLEWYNTPLGKELAKLEHKQLAQILTKLPGNHLLQLGTLGTQWLDASRVMYKWTLDPCKECQPSVLANYDELPFPKEMFDIVILPHVLENAANYPAVLREAARVMSGEGCLVILGFNPYSLATLSKAKPGLRKLPNLHKLRYWLKQSSCEVETAKTFFYRPFTQQKKLLLKLQALEIIGQMGWAGFGSCYIILARKKITAVIPLQQKLKNWWRYLTTKPMVEPSTRNQINE